MGAADKAAILLVKVQPHQLLVLDAKRYHGLGQVTNEEVAWCERPGCLRRRELLPVGAICGPGERGSLNISEYLQPRNVNPR